MSWRPRVVSIGGVTGMVGTLLGGSSVLMLRADLGWLIGLLAGGAAGGLGSWLAAKRVLRDATACLAAVGDGSDGPETGRYGPDGARPAPVLGSEDFDAWMAHLHEVLDRSRRVQAEHAGVLRLAQQLQAAMTGPGAAGGSSARPGPDREGTAESLRILLDQFQQTAVPINRDLSGLEEANERVASGAQDQSEAVSRTATSVEALSDRIDRIAHHAGEAADACERARLEAHQGLDQVHSVIDGMDRLLTRIEVNGRKVRRLEERSTEIGVIVDLIRGISGRTDMLALNATIESIRAGEHGRGFAVIAEEIRKLAERTAGATREIGTLVEAIQADTQESLQALGEEQAQMQGESQQLRETGCSLERISQVAERSARLVEGISRSTNDQVLATQDLVRAMQRISEVTHQTQERTVQARGFIRALKQSCEPWQRLAAADPVPHPAGRPMAPSPRATEGSSRHSLREDGPALVSPTALSARASGSAQRGPGPRGIGSERAR
jgi:ABC-type transporter Mla subunit MlaD